MKGFEADPFRAEAGLRVEHQHASLRIPVDRCRRLLLHVIASEGAALEEVSVILADHETVLDLNRRFLEHDYLTDVLAFNFSDEEGVVEGEIYVDLDTAMERCEEFGTEYEEEALRYAVHGLLHLIGYSDGSPERKREMRALENRYLHDALPG